MADDETFKCFMDGLDWQHHIGADISGVRLYPSVEDLKAGSRCVVDGGCGVVEIEVKFVRWVEPQDLKFHDAPLPPR